MKNKFDAKKLLEAMEYCVDPLKQVDENGDCLSDICPYVGPHYTNYCEDCLMRNALAYIRYQDKKIDRLKSKVRGLKGMLDIAYSNQEEEEK